MSEPTITATKEIPREVWEDWFDGFTLANVGRLVNIELVNNEVGDEPMADDMPFVAVDYDTITKGNDFVITYGEERAPTSHVIQAPTRLWLAEDDEGKVVSLEFEDDNDGHTIINFH